MTLKQRIGRVLIPKLPVSRFAFDVLRLELACWRARLGSRFLPSRFLKVRALKKRTGLLANAACGPFTIPGFVNLDLVAHTREILPWDCTRSLPFGDGACRGIRAEHFLEHLEHREQVPVFLKECLRCLEPDGVLRIVVPDAGAFLKAYASMDTSRFAALGMFPFPDDLPNGMDVVSHVFHQGSEHRWAYDFQNLKHQLERLGFIKIEKMSFGSSLCAELGQDREQHKSYSLYVDAVKGN